MEFAVDTRNYGVMRPEPAHRPELKLGMPPPQQQLFYTTSKMNYTNDGNRRYAVPTPNYNLKSNDAVATMMYPNLDSNKRERGILGDTKYTYSSNKTSALRINWSADNILHKMSSRPNSCNKRHIHNDNCDNAPPTAPDPTVASSVKYSLQVVDYTDPLIKARLEDNKIINNGAVESSNLAVRPDVAPNAVDRNMPM